MTRLERLQELVAKQGRPVRVALIGTGQMGRGLAAQIGRIPGLELAAAVDVDVDRARQALSLAGHDRFESSAARYESAINDGIAIATTDSSAVSELPIDVVVEATGVPGVGAHVAWRSILARQHVVLLNVEADVTVGRYLAAMADSAGVVYSIADGDEPVAAKELVDLAHELSFEVICAGKGKNNPFDPHATPESCLSEATRKNMNPNMLASFQDGSKTQIEMAALANATGLPPDVTGMHGPTASVEELPHTLIPQADGGMLSEPGRVEYAFGPAPGVFVVVSTDDDAVAEEMTYLSMGDGPYFVLYRPYHLASIEAPRTILTAVLDGRSALRPAGWTAEVVATAKRDLKPGDVLDGIGGRHMRGVIHAAEDAAGLVPLGLAEGATVEQPVTAGEPIPEEALALRSSTIGQLRELQNQLFADDTAHP